MAAVEMPADMPNYQLTRAGVDPAHTPPAVYKILCPRHLALRPDLQTLERTPTREPCEECIEDAVAAESYPE